MGSGGVAIAALPTVTCLKVPFSDGLGGEIFGNKENYMVEWGDADDDGYPDTEEGHNEYEKDCQSGKQPWKGHKIFHDRYRSSIVEAYLSANNQ